MAGALRQVGTSFSYSFFFATDKHTVQVTSCTLAGVDGAFLTPGPDGSVAGL